ncbi:nucleoside triphosphate pyrophosphohydrolase [Fonticella tunisiensis]|uniref:Tetrapyrrole methylase family protein/MazG family protein n=1 Tax=Fonticella tunisiensis TaxID=1096341 RepID=A0A4R7KX16_9CLOT|nr:nucleoside triphosphate pyrophosphohydrolase [Fonticella tunisiensis]TDT63466.1 tetrapyrrole methylase family protein/MazG family protein [Fonticella tunisiensis]
MIKVVGLGPGNISDLTIKTLEVMREAEVLYLRTSKHPNVEYIKSLGIDFKTFDEYYDRGENFDEIYEKMARKIVSLKNVVYAVPGNPLVAEKSVQLILEYAKDEGIDVEIVPALSFIDAVLNILKVDPVEGFKIIDGLQLEVQRPDTAVGNVVTQVYSRLIASDVKIRLMEYYDDEHEVYLIRAAGVPGLERVEKLPLYEIDRVDWVDYLTSLYIPPVKNKKKYDFQDLIDVLETLRSEKGCPWDREQTHESLKKYLIEESYEVLDAIDRDDMEGLCEELGDVLLQVVFHSQIGKEFGEFDIRDVVHGITNKMINRHPHVFGDVKAETADDVLYNWESIKRDEKNIESHTESLMSVPRVLPALIRSYKVQEKASKVGFDWDNIDDAISKVCEELNEFLEVYKTQKNGRIIEELGDLIFSIVNVARFLKVDPEFALTKTTEKFITRFKYIESEGAKRGKKLEDMTLDEMDELWNRAKKG